MSKSIDLWEDYSSMSYMVKEFSKEMESVVKLAMKPIHEHIDQIVQTRTQKLHRPTRRTWRNLNEGEESVDRHSFVSNRRPSQDLESFCARMDQRIKNFLQNGNSENIITAISTIQNPKEEVVVECDSSADTEEDGGAEPEMLSEEEPAAEEIEALVEHILVSKEALDVQIRVGEEEQRNNTFYLKFDVEDKVCSMVIDGRRCINVVSVKEKLVLPILKHPKSYRLQWLNDSGVVKATKQRKGGFVFDPGIDDSDLRTNPSQEEGNDAAQGVYRPTEYQDQIL